MTQLLQNLSHHDASKGPDDIDFNRLAFAFTVLVDRAMVTVGASCLGTRRPRRSKDLDRPKLKLTEIWGHARYRENSDFVAPFYRFINSKGS